MRILSLLKKIVEEPEQITSLVYKRENGRIILEIGLRNGEKLNIEASGDVVKIGGERVRVSLGEVEGEIHKLIRQIICSIKHRIEEMEQEMVKELEKIRKLLT